MEDLTAFSVRKVKAQQQRKEKVKSIPLQKDSESQSKKQNYFKDLSKN